MFRLQSLALRRCSRVRRGRPRRPHLVHHLRPATPQEADVHNQRHVGKLAQVRLKRLP